MPRQNKVFKKCKNARNSAKISKFCEPLISIDNLNEYTWRNKIVELPNIAEQQNDSLSHVQLLIEELSSTEFEQLFEHLLKKRTEEKPCPSRLTFIDIDMTSSLENSLESPILMPIDNNVSESLNISNSSLLDIPNLPNIELLNANIRSLPESSNTFSELFNNSMTDLPNVQLMTQTVSRVERIKKDLISKINYMSEKELVSCSQLFVNIVYKDGPHKGEILSPYLQKKVSEWVLTNSGKPNVSSQEIRLLKANNSQLKRKIDKLTSRAKALAIKLRHSERSKSTHVSQIRSIVRKKKNISDKDIEKTIIKKIKQDKKAYTPEFVSLATDLSNIGQMSISSTVQCTKEIMTFLTGNSPESWLSSSTLSRWNKEVAQISVQQNLPQLSNQFGSYGIMADESTRGEKKIFLVCVAYWDERKKEPMLTILSMKDLDRCSASTVLSSVGETINMYSLDPAKCQYWLTDNTAYMSGSKAGAIVEFNKQYSTKAIRIPCGLHVLHIASAAFDNITFGKNNSPSGLSLHPHPFNVLNLAHHLHCGYNESNKDNPLNMKTDTITKLYKALINYDFKRYQKPISSRWLYQLTTAKQYLDQRDAHLQFSEWFVHKLETASNVPEGYLKKWKIFCEFLQNERLNIEIQVMVCFGEYFYEKIMFFLIGKDNHLPCGFRASEMPDKVEEWINEFQTTIEHVDEVFIEELLLAHEVLPENESFDLTNKIENGLIKALETFKKWMDPWMHLPLSICRLGGTHGPDFAFAIAKVVINAHLPDEPTSVQKKYINELVNDLKTGKKESFGLFQALEDNEFQEQFLAFSRSVYTELVDYPLICEFVNHRIWSIIVHQQHLEGMFNRYDLKTHPNMTIDLQEAKMQLTGPKTLRTLLTKESLSKIRSKRKQKEVIVENNPINREETAFKLLERFLKPSK